MELEEKIRHLRKEVDGELELFFDNKILQAKSNDMPEEFFEIIANVRNFMLRGGKRLRPILFYYGYTLAGGDEGKNIIASSLLTEFLHTYLLIHDDIIDRDNLRHGGPSMHYKYQKDYAEKYEGCNLEHFGVSMAINVGDIVSSWSYEILFKSDFDCLKKQYATEKMSQIVEDTLTGQVLDEFLEMGVDFDEKKIYKVQNYKTARYTICGPLQLGAIFAGADEEELRFISDFSIPLGIAYQIQDDILGVFGDKEKIGKPVGSDIKEGKKTLLMSYALRKTSDKEKNFLYSCLGKKDLNEDEVQKVREIIRDSGALEYSRQKIDEFIEDFLCKLKNNTESFSLKYTPLEDFANYLLKRKK
ncbi:MAG: polyprenyl synthetase family protein [Candidatus Paceibacterota bacterium]